ncbi:hypothetical protein QT19_00080, partial [Staphylococcus aureus]
VRLLVQGLDVGEHRLEDGGGAAGDRHLFGDEGVGQGGGVLRHVAAGEDDLVRHQGGGLREAPGLAVEHGGDDHGGVPERHADRGGQGIRVQHDRAVRVEHPLRPAGRAGGVARAVGGGLLDLRPVDVRGGRGQEVLV